MLPAKATVTERADGAQVEDFPPVEFQACRLGVCGGRSTQTADTRASAGLLRLEFEQFRKGYSIAAKERPRKNGEEMPEATWEPHEKHVTADDGE